MSPFDSSTTASHKCSHYLSSMHRLKVALNFLIVDYDGMSSSTARGRLIPEVTSPVDRATMAVYSCFVYNYRPSPTASMP
jgi:hypothetical protein